MKKQIVFVLVVLLSSLNARSQKIINQFPVFNSGERITYKAAYNWGFIWINAGNVEFRVTESEFENQKAYRLNCYGTSLPSYDWLFKVRDYYQSYVRKENLTPIYYDRNTYEGGFQVHNRFRFNYSDSVIYSETQNTNRSYKLDTLNITKTVYDVVSGVYLIRNMDFDNYKINDTIPIIMIIDSEIFNLYVRYLGKEILKIHNKRVFKTIKLSALLIDGTIFSGGEDLFVWITDDLNRIPILVEAKIRIGSVKAILNTTENLKFPLSSEIKR